MAIIKPFKGIRPAQSLVEQVASKPYDVLNSAEAREEVQGNPYSFLHVIKSEVDLPAGVDVHSDAVYQKARENFTRFLAEKVLVQDDKECFYLYQQTMNGRTQNGLVACSAVSDYFEDVIKKHEFTRPVKEQDRIQHMKTLGAHPGPVFMTYPDVAAVNELLKPIEAGQPEYDFTAEGDIRHTLWVIDDPGVIQQLIQLFAVEVPATYIADGHHRAASSAKVGKALAAENPAHTGQEAYNYFLTVLFPSSQLMIIDYNRVVKDLNGMTADEFLKKLEAQFSVQAADSTFKPAQLHEFGLYLEGQWYQMHAKPGTFRDDDPIAVLDVTILQNNVLDSLLAIHDPRTDDRVDFVGGIRGLQELEKRVDSGEMAAAFALFPVTIQQLIDISDSGNVMPPKSTWFEPKLKSGLVVHQFSN